jgi:glycosyltransferase involved in cell wall biosynthesis/SAM-dependent methyltransferase
MGHPRGRAAVITPFFADRDAVCNDVRASAEILRREGWDTRVFALGGTSAREAIHPLGEMGAFVRDSGDLAYYHFSTGRHDVTEAIAALRCRRWLKFHNITPPELFSVWSDELAEASRVGRAEMPAIGKIPWEQVWGDSSFNLQEIAPYLTPGTARGVLPPFHETESLLAAAPQGVAPASPASLVTVGRLVQSKGHPFLLRVMRYLVHDLRVEATLDIVGKPDHRLAGYARMLELVVREYALERHVRFRGEIDEASLARHYASASVFVTTSEHEGFCVPIVEAMAFGVPVVALATSAVPETVGEAGIVWPERDPRRFAVTLAELLRDPGEMRALSRAGLARYRERFARRVLEQQFTATIAPPATQAQGEVAPPRSRPGPSDAPGHALLADLARAGMIVWPAGGSAVRAIEGRLVSADGLDLGPTGGPANFLESVRERPSDPGLVPVEDIERLRAQLGLPDTAPMRDGIAASIAATGIRFEQQHLSAESRMLAERFRMTPFASDAQGNGPQQSPGRLTRLLRGRSFSAGRLDFVSDSVGAVLTASRQVHRSVRVRNGEHPLACAGIGSARIVTSFADMHGHPVAQTEAITPLPVDIEPGREITLIITLRTPGVAGRFTLSARLEQGGSRREPFMSLAVQVADVDLPVFEYEYHPQLLEYPSDRHVSMLETLRFLDARLAGPPMTTLEIGGGVHPIGRALVERGHRVVSADISHAHSILGTLVAGNDIAAAPAALAFVSCDGTRLPFADGTFHGVTMYAAFHHFAEPMALLAELKRVTTDDAFIFIGGETCGPNPADEQYREELRRGINEQMWTLEEFTGFFRDAGLAVAQARVDGHSLKVALLKRR